VFEDLVRDLRMVMREIDDRMSQPRAAILDSRTVQSTPESGGHAGHDGHKRRKGTKVHLAVAIYVAPLGAIAAIGALVGGCTLRIERREPADEE
jgi:hypothetical protein